MTPEQQAAFIMAQIVCAQIEMNAMLAHDNQEPDPQHHYSHKDYMALQDKYVVGHNAVISFFQGG